MAKVATSLSPNCHLFAALRQESPKNCVKLHFLRYARGIISIILVKELGNTFMHRFAVRGLSFNNAALSLREKFCLSKEAVADFYSKFPRLDGEQWVLITTCNRVELYYFGPKEGELKLLRHLESVIGELWPDSAGFYHSGREALNHLFRVAAGLESQVLGDGQILSQVRDAYHEAQKYGVVDAELHRIFQAAFRVGKRVRTETNLYFGVTSVSGAAVRAGENFLGALSDKKVLLVGAGQMGEIAAQVLCKRGVKSLTIVNRTRAHAERLAGRLGVGVADWSQLGNELAEADFVIVALATKATLIDNSLLKMRQKPCLVVDVSVPRAVDANVIQVENYTLHDLESLSEEIKSSRLLREEALPDAESIILHESTKLQTWLQSKKLLNPLAVELGESLERVRKRELKFALKALPKEIHPLIEELTRRMAERFVRIPVSRLKELSSKAEGLERVEKLLTEISR